MSKQIVGRTTEDVTRLPKWARDRLDRMSKEVEHWKSIAHATSTPGETNVTLVEGIEERGLPPNSRVRFQLGKRETIEVSIGRGDEAAIEVRSTDGSLVVMPAVSNIVYIGIQPHGTRRTASR